MHKRTKKVLLGTAGLAVTLAPGLLGVVQSLPVQSLVTVAMAEEAAVSEFTGEFDTKGLPVDQGLTYSNNSNLIIPGFKGSIKLNGRVKAGQTVTLESTFRLGEGDVAIGDKKVGQLKQLKIETIPTDGDLENRTDVRDFYIYTYQMTFNKEIEEFENPEVKFSGVNLNANIPKFLKDGGKKIVHQIKVGDKKVQKEFFYRGQSFWEGGSHKFWVDNWKMASSDGSVVRGENFPLTILQGTKDNLIKAGDRVVFELTGDSGVGFLKTDGPKIGETFIGLDYLDNPTRETVILNKKTGILYRKKGQEMKLKFVEVTPKKVVVEVVDPGGPGLSAKLEHAGLKTVILDQSNKTVDVENNRLKGVQVKSYFLRDGKKIGENTQNSFGLIEGLKLSADAQKVKRGSVVVNLVDSETGDPIKESDIVKTNVVTGEDYSVDPNGYKVPGYTYKGLRDGSAGLTGKVVEGTQTVVLEFVKDAEKPEDEEIITSFLEEGSGEKLKDPVKAEKEAEPGTIEGYQFVRTERKGNQVTHWFKKKEEPKKPETKQPNTRYVDEDGKVIEEVPGSQDKKEIPGYTYLRTEKDKDGNITHIYHKIVTRFVTDKGMTLKQMDGAQPKEEIDGYEFVETKTDEKTGDVTHVYREVTPTAEPFTILKEDKGNVLKTAKGTHDPEDLPGYRYLRTEKDKDGNTVHIYHRIVTNFVTVKDGKEEVLKTKDGVQPKEEIDGYEFVETKTDEKLGDIKHYYKVKVVAGAEKKAPVQTGGSASMMILPAAAVLGLGGLVAGLARRKNN